MGRLQFWGCVQFWTVQRAQWRLCLCWQIPIHSILLGQTLFHALVGGLDVLRGAEGPMFDSIVELHLLHVSTKTNLWRSD